MKFMGPKEVGWRVFGALACIWGLAIAARLALNAMARVWPLAAVAAVGALVWLVLRRRR